MQKTEKIRTFLKKPLAFAVIENCICLLLSLFVFHPHFEENDDAIIAFIAEGAYGARDSHLVYVNYCWGEVLQFLYRLCSGIRWHSVMQYVGIMIAFTAISYILIYEKKEGRLLSVLFLLCTFYEAYVSLQYTKTAAIVSVAGYLVLLYCLRVIRRGVERGTEWMIAVGMLLLFYGLLLRSSCFYMATAVFVIPVIYEMWGVRKETDAGHKKRLVIAYLTSFVTLAAAVCAFHYADCKAYSEQEAWKKFSAFNEKRTDLLDYRYDLMDYQSQGTRLKEIGVSENDALLYLTWQFGDGDVFHIGLMDEILDSAARRDIGIDTIKGLAAHIYEELYALSAIVIGGVCMGIWLLLGKNRMNRYLLLYLGAVLLVVLCYYEYSGRWNHRVVFAILFAVLALLFQYGTTDEKKPLMLIAGICIFLNVGLLMQDTFAYNRYMREEAPDAAELLAYTRQNEEQLYLIDPFTDQTAYRYDVFKAYQEGELKNRTYFGGWLTHSPIYEKVLNNYGYRNAFQALKSSDRDERIYLIDNYYPEEKLLYLEEHYGVKYSLEIVDTIGKYNVYQLQRQ